MSARGKQVEDGTNRAVKKLAAAILQTVVFSTPVDTGRARSNWLVTLGSPSSATLEPFSAGDHLGISETANAAAAIAAGNATIPRRVPEQTVYIQNNLDYIGLLNSDQTPSVQAPPQFVQKAIQKAIDALKTEGVFT
jgi:hypothetical protein